MAGYVGFSRPTLSEIRERVYSDINNMLPGQDARIAYTPLNAIAEAEIGLAYELYGYQDWIARQTNVLDCEAENLDKYGSIWGIVRKTATYTTGTVTFTGVNSATVPTGTVIQSNTGMQYITTADGTISSGSATVAVKAILAGKVYNLSTSTQLFLTSTLSGIDTTCTVVSLTGGADNELDADYRARIISRITFPSHGGSKQDYITWALECTGVTRAWCYPEELGAGTVTVRFMMDNTYSDGIPLTSDITTVYNYINNLRPVTAKLSVYAPIAVPLNVTVTGLHPNNAQTQTAAIAEITDMIKSKAVPGGTIRLSWIWEAVSLATGTQYHTITTPAADVTYTTGQIAVPGTITFA